MGSGGEERGDGARAYYFSTQGTAAMMLSASGAKELWRHEGEPEKMWGARIDG